MALLYAYSVVRAADGPVNEQRHKCKFIMFMFIAVANASDFVKRKPSFRRMAETNASN